MANFTRWRAAGISVANFNLNLRWVFAGGARTRAELLEDGSGLQISKLAFELLLGLGGFVGPILKFEHPTLISASESSGTQWLLIFDARQSTA